MSSLRIEGGRRLSGSVVVSGAKNSALKLMAASLLAQGRTLLTNVPRIADVFTMIDVVSHVGANVDFVGNVMAIDVPAELRSEAPYELVHRMRASVNVLGPLLARQGHARVAMPGGCNIGSRPIDLHEEALGRMGVSFHFDHGYLEGVAPTLNGRRIALEYPSRGATENVLTAATLARGRTVIDNAAREPDIVDLARFLNQMGAKVTGAGTPTIEIEGVGWLAPATYRVPSDPIEAGSLALAALATRGEVELIGAMPHEIEVFLAKLSASGAQWWATPAGVVVSIARRPTAVDFATLPYPGFPTDLQAQMIAYLCTAEGTSIVTENLFESRFAHLAELGRMGADLRVEGHQAVVRGVPRLEGAPVLAHDLRGGVALIIAALGAEGVSEVHDIHHVERGYEDLPGKLRALGAEVDASGWGDAAMPGSPWGREEQESPWGREEVNVPEAPSYHPR
ncbi:MAG TPA: UDP-N-acetylglucosamine 1-carboxyvinyltransferase [Actinomycetota bacterium]|nr:UDP-N-acetylglucosamine 1-carboxyvinyltransferase [Actinomycetota bacterium]